MEKWKAEKVVLLYSNYIDMDINNSDINKIIDFLYSFLNFEKLI